jgi:signal transduction histidine kinase
MEINNLIVLFIAGIVLLLVKLAVVIYLLVSHNKMRYALQMKERQLSFVEALLGEREISFAEMGRTTHDEIAQIACLIKHQAHKLENHCCEGKQLEIICQMQRWIDAVIAQSTALALSLNGEFFKSKSISSLIEDELKLAKEHNDITYLLSAYGNLEDFGHEDRMLIYKIAKEGIANSIKHGNPSRINVKLDLRESRFSLWVEDDGCGIMPEKIFGIRGNGMPNMHYRAKLLNGSISMNSLPGGGCRLELSIADIKQKKD